MNNLIIEPCGITCCCNGHYVVLRIPFWQQLHCAKDWCYSGWQWGKSSISFVILHTPIFLWNLGVDFFFVIICVWDDLKCKLVFWLVFEIFAVSMVVLLFFGVIAWVWMDVGQHPLIVSNIYMTVELDMCITFGMVSEVSETVWNWKGKKSRETKNGLWFTWKFWNWAFKHKLVLQTISKIRYWTAEVLSCLWCNLHNSIALPSFVFPLIFRLLIVVMLKKDMGLIVKLNKTWLISWSSQKHAHKFLALSWYQNCFKKPKSKESS